MTVPALLFHPVYAPVHPSRCDDAEEYDRLLANGWYTTQEEAHAASMRTPTIARVPDVDASVAVEAMTDDADADVDAMVDAEDAAVEATKNKHTKKKSKK